MWFGVDLGGRRIIKKIFFKQKTAYEIQSCDWSSDVCSSDLERINKALATRIDQLNLLNKELDTANLKLSDRKSVV